METKFLHYRIISAVQRAECAGDRESYAVLRGRLVTSLFWIRMHQLRRKATIIWTVLWVLEEVCNHLSNYRVKILLGDINAKFGRGDLSN